MAVMIQEPANANPVTNDWQKIILKLTQTTGGLMLVDFTEKQTTGIPKIKQGSRFELNGSFFIVKSDETIQEWGNVNNNIWVYCYLRALGFEQGEFYWSPEQPAYQVEKGGWFHPTNNERAILSARKVNNTTCRAKALIGQVFKYPVPDEKTGTQIASNANSGSVIANIETGWYRAELKGGKGGQAGNGGNSGRYADSFGTWGDTNTSANEGIGDAVNGQTGTAGTEGETQTFYLWLEKGTIELRAGRTGTTGNSGTNGTNGSSSTKGAGDGGDGADGGDGEGSALFNNGVLVAFVSGGKGGSGGSGGKGGWGWSATRRTNPDPLLADYPIYTVELTGRPSNGSRGTMNSGYSYAYSGSVAVYAL